MIKPQGLIHVTKNHSFYEKQDTFSPIQDNYFPYCLQYCWMPQFRQSGFSALQT